ncbi:MAG: hypothetical protein OHK0017_09570 [Patescibacteria group bacterium]
MEKYYNYQKYEEFWNLPLSDYHRLLEPFLNDFFNNYLGSHIIEIGFGSGHLPLILSKQGFEGQYLGVDIDPDATNFAQDLIQNNFPSKSNHFKFIVPSEPDQLISSQKYDLAIFCLSACEMESEIINEYLRNIKADKVLMINPSSTSAYYPPKITKTWLSKITSRFGSEPKWKLIADLPPLGTQLSIRHLGGDPALKATMLYRPFGEYVNLLKDAGFQFERYWDLRYTESNIKTAPVSKFEVVLATKKAL